MFDLSTFAGQLQLTVALFGVAAVMLLAAALWPAEAWVTQSRPLISSTDTVEERRMLPALLQAVGMIFLMLLATLFFLFVMHLPYIFSLIMGVGVVALIVPLIKDMRAGRHSKRGRLEAVRLSQYVAGRLNARSSLHAALRSAVQRHNENAMDLAVCGKDLQELVRAVELNEDMADNLLALAARFRDIPEMAGLFKNYAVMSRSNLGVQARITQAEDAAEELVRLDAVKNDLDVELTTSRGTRMMMMLLMTGLCLYLISAGGVIGDTLINTLPGNVAIGLAVGMLIVSQIVATRIEKMPMIRF